MADRLIEMDNRDPKDMNIHTVVQFEDVIGEPQHVESMRCTWQYSETAFIASKNICYIILTTLFGLPISICCGLRFATLTFVEVWICMPCLVAMKMSLVSVRSMYNAFMRCLLDPWCGSFGLLFANIKATLANDKGNNCVCENSCMCPNEKP